MDMLSKRKDGIVWDGFCALDYNNLISNQIRRMEKIYAGVKIKWGFVWNVTKYIVLLGCAVDWLIGWAFGLDAGTHTHNRLNCF